jgi:hypothetical protein
MSLEYHQDGCARVEEGLGSGGRETSESNIQTSTVAPKIEPQLEPHSQNSSLVRDAIIGLADGLTVPFALTAGLSSLVLSFSLLQTADFSHLSLSQPSTLLFFSDKYLISSPELAQRTS